MLHRFLRKGRAFKNDIDGSDTVEMVITTSMLVTFLLVVLMFISYVMMANEVNFVVKRLTRNIETTGQYNIVNLRTSFHEALTRPQLQPEDIIVSDVDEFYTTGKIQLKSTFRVTGKCIYTVSLLNPGNFSGFDLKLPIITSVTGMSEVYWGS